MLAQAVISTTLTKIQGGTCFLRMCPKRLTFPSVAHTNGSQNLASCSACPCSRPSVLCMHPGSPLEKTFLDFPICKFRIQFCIREGGGPGNQAFCPGMQHGHTTCPAPSCPTGWQSAILTTCMLQPPTACFFSSMCLCAG